MYISLLVYIYELYHSINEPFGRGKWYKNEWFLFCNKYLLDDTNTLYYYEDFEWIFRNAVRMIYFREFGFNMFERPSSIIVYLI